MPISIATHTPVWALHIPIPLTENLDTTSSANAMNLILVLTIPDKQLNSLYIVSEITMLHNPIKRHLLHSVAAFEDLVQELIY